MTATEELRRLLDERGMEHYDGIEYTLWIKDGTVHRACAEELRDGYMNLHIHKVTPAQAVAAVEAALGRGKCKYESVNLEINLENSTIYCFEHVLTCGHSFLGARSTHVKFCPECGREVER